MYNQLKLQFSDYKNCLKESKITKEIKVLENNCYDKKGDVNRILDRCE